LCLGHPNG